jgi:hypothetical protein
VGLALMPPGFRRHALANILAGNQAIMASPAPVRRAWWHGTALSSSARLVGLSLPNVQASPLAYIRQRGSVFDNGATPPKYIGMIPFFAICQPQLTCMRVFVLKYLPFAQRLSHHNRFSHLEPDMVAMP